MRRPARRSGFTLMELLIVIAIVGILAGMLFPAINYVREKARKDECLNNLRQWGVAMQGYLDEHRGVFPTYGPALAEGSAWYNVLPSYLGLDAMKDMDRIPHPGAGIKSPFLCPSESVGIDGAQNTSSYFSSYTLNSWVDNGANVGKNFTKRLRISQLNEQHDPPVTPATFVVFSETENGTKGGVDLSTLTEKACRHARSLNLCFADGHAENVFFNHLGCGLAADRNYGGRQWNPGNPDLSGKEAD